MIEINPSKPSQPNANKHHRVVNALRGRIRSGELRVGEKLPTFGQIKDEFGVATNTVNRALIIMEQDGLIVRRRGSGIYVANTSVLTKPLSIGCFQFDYELASPFGDANFSHYPHDLLDGVMRGVGQTECDVVLLRSGATLDPERLDGIVAQADLSLMDIPPGLHVVSIFNVCESIPSVIADDFCGTYMATKHLLELGHTKIGCMMYSEAPVMRPRIAGYLLALFEAGIRPETNWVFDMYREGHATYEHTGELRMGQWLECGFRETGITAILMQNDWVAVSAMDELKRAGYRVPEDISIVGYDGTVACERCAPTLTSVEIPVNNVAVTATRLLLRKISGETVDPLVTVLPVRLEVRASTGPSPK